MSKARASQDTLPQKYQALLRVSHWEPQTHPRMSRAARAAQFSPFAALTGFYDEIEAKRLELAERRDVEVVQESEPWPGDDWADPKNSPQSP